MNIDLSDATQQEDFLRGVIDHMQKVARMNPIEILDALEKFAVMRIDEKIEDKTASIVAEVEDAFNEEREKIAAWYNPFSWKADMERNAGVAAADRMLERTGLDSLMSGKFMSTAAPWVIGGIGGYLLPKLMGAERSNTEALAHTAAGAAIGGIGTGLLRHGMRGNSKAWDYYKKEKGLK